MINSGSDSTVDLKDNNRVYVDDENNNINNDTGSIVSNESINSSQENLRGSIELLKHEQQQNPDLRSKQKVHSVPVSRESLEENDSIIITRVATEDTMSSSPSSYTSSRNIPITNNVHNNVISIERRPSPLAFKESTLNPNNHTLKDDNIKTASNNNEEEEEPSMIQISNIINLPTDILIKMVTALLEKIIQSNDNLNGLHPQNKPLERLPENEGNNNNDSDDDYYRNCYNAALSFRGKHVPQINLEQYFHRIQKYCPITNDVYLSLLIYFDRISKKCNNIKENLPKGTLNNNNNNNNNKEGKDIEEEENSQIFVMDSFNIHRLIITAVTVSTKFSSDFFYSNSRYSKVGGISLKEMNFLELQFLILCDFNLLISIDEFERYSTLLYRFWDSLETV